MAHLKLQTTGYVLTEAAVLLNQVRVQYNPQLLSVKALYTLLDMDMDTWQGQEHDEGAF